MSSIRPSISTLPVELIDTILVFALPIGAVQYGPRALRPLVALVIAFSSVLRTWRSHMLSSPKFWTFPELVLDGSACGSSYSLAELWAERSKSAPLHLFILTFRDSPSTSYTPSDWTTKISNLTKTLLAQTRTLVIGMSHQTVDRLLPQILDLWVTHGAAGQAKRLDVYQILAGDTQPSGNLPLGAYTTVDTQLHADFFRSTETLVVGKMWRDLGALAHDGLTDLHVERSAGQFKTLQSVHKLVVAAPRLRSLRLIDMLGRKFGDARQVASGGLQPAHLDQLETLVLEGKHSWRLLDVITSTAKGIKASVSLEDTQRCITTLCSFLDHASVLHLYLQLIASDKLGYIPEIMTHTSDLKFLAVHGFGEGKFLNQTRQPSSESLRPVLDELHLVECNIKAGIVWELTWVCRPKMIFWLSNHMYPPLKVDRQQGIEHELEETGAVLVQKAWKKSCDYWECN